MGGKSVKGVKSLAGLYPNISLSSLERKILNFVSKPPEVFTKAMSPKHMLACCNCRGSFVSGIGLRRAILVAPVLSNPMFRM